MDTIDLQNITERIEMIETECRLLKIQLQQKEKEKESLIVKRRDILSSIYGITIGVELLVTDEFLQLENVRLYPNTYHKDMTLYLGSIWENGTCAVSDESPLERNCSGTIGNIPMAVVQNMRQAWLNKNAR